MRSIAVGAACTCVFCACLTFGSIAAAQPEHPDREKEIEEIVLTLPHGHRRSEIVAGTTVLSGEELERAMSPTIGETLTNQPGISSTGYAPGASRPVIRGLGGQRVRVLQNRIDSLDASVTSPDHAVAVEPLMAERVEVIRGPGTLIYGSAAVGGVVNVEDGRIPTRIPDDGVEAAVRTIYGSNAEEKNAAAGVTAGYGNVAVNAQGYFRDTNDFDAPGFTRSAELREIDPLEDEPRGRVENSDIDAVGGTIGGSYIWDDGHLGVSFGVRDDEYGIPGGAHAHEHDEEEEHGPEDHELAGADPHDEEEEGENVRIDADQWRIDLDGELRYDLIAFDTARLRFGYADYEHKELEGSEVGTRFSRDSWEARLELLQAEWRALEGVVGLQISDGDYDSVGDEAFVPLNDTFRAALFVVEEYSFGPYSVEGAFRYEHQDSDAPGIADRNFDGFSFSLGANREIFDDYLVGATFGRTERLPGPEELFADGPHLATFSYERGDPDLNKETALSIEATLRKQYGRIRGDLNFFYYRYQDFIFEQRTGEVEDGLDVFQFQQADAEFLGGEFVTTAQVFEHRYFDAFADFQIDYVYAELVDDDMPLPRIPPLRLLVGAEAENEYLHGRIEFQWVDSQTRTADLELPTDDYYRLNFSLGWHPFPDRYDLIVRLDCRNLTDAKGRNHVSFLKDTVPLPGRDIRVSVQLKI